MFYSHVIYLGTKIVPVPSRVRLLFYSHVIYLGTKIIIAIVLLLFGFTVT